MKVIDRTKAVTQHFLENSFKKLSIKKKENKKWKIRKTQKYVFSKCLLRHDVVRVFVSSLVFLYGQFCHGALKHDISTLFTTFFVWTSLQFIFSLPLMSSFNKTEAAISPLRLCFCRTFTFSYNNVTYYSLCLVLVWRV